MTHDHQVRLQQLCVDRRDGRKTVEEVLTALAHSTRLNLWLRHPVIDDRSVVSLTVRYQCNIDTDSVVFRRNVTFGKKTFVRVHILA